MPKAPKKINEEHELLKAQLVRALADYDNFRKRTEREREELALAMKARVVRNFLPVLDMLYEAQNHLKDGGLALTINSFESALTDQGLEAISPKEGEEFSEDLHEVVDTGAKEGFRDGQIIKCVLRGWRFKDGQVIRHAKVVVSKTK